MDSLKREIWGLTGARCQYERTDPFDDVKLKEARLSKDAHVLTPDSMEMLERIDKNGTVYLQVKYHDYDARCLVEMHYLNNASDLKKFAINFLRSHLRKPELKLNLRSVSEAIQAQSQLRMPAFVIARKQGKYWKITEKIFGEEFNQKNG